MRATAAEKLQRLISIVSWIHHNDGPTLDEVCQRFGITRKELISQLDMANMIGAESEEFGDMPIAVTYEGDQVFVFLLEFRRPLRLTPDQALALVAAGAALTAVEGADPDGPLARALAKLAGVLGVEPGEALDIDLGDADAAVLDLARRAVDDHVPLAIDYWSAGHDRSTHRVVEPWRVFSEAGAWYLQGHCRLSGEPRVFRVDRIRHAEAAEGTFTPPAALPEATAYTAGADDPRVVLDLGPEARWVAATYPIDRADDLGDGRLRVTMPAGAQAFLARLLLRLGPDATIVSIDDRSGGPAVAADAARRILARYGADG